MNGAAWERQIRYTLDVTRHYHNLLKLEEGQGRKDQTFYWDGNVAAMEEDGLESYYLQDDLGSPMQLLDENGEIRESYGFDEFGMSLFPEEDPGHQVQPFGYTGYQMEEAGGVYYAQARRYDAGTGRFVGRDKERYQRFHKPNTLNRYIYCENNPVTYIDPRGNTLEDCYTTSPGKDDPVQVTISGDTITIDAYVDITGDVNYVVGNSTAHDLVIEGIENWAGRPTATMLASDDVMRDNHQVTSSVSDYNIQMMVMAASTDEWQYFMAYDGHKQSRGVVTYGPCTQH